MEKYDQTNDEYEIFESKDEIASNFDIHLDVLKDVEILVAVYEPGDYEGYAWVLFMKDGKLYEVHASHCSCNHLEDQWDPEETSWEAIDKRRSEGNTFLKGIKPLIDKVKR